MAVHIDKIRLDGGTQARAALNETTVAEYAEAMTDPDTVFPPVTVYFDGTDYWLADGFHRLAAWRQIGRTDIPADIRQGDRRRAVLHSVAANAAHGLRRTNDDKRRAVMTLLEDPEWSQWSDREIARRCGVSHPFVSALRSSLTGNITSDEPRTYITKHGETAKMKTAKIGSKRRDAQVIVVEDEKRLSDIEVARLHGIPAGQNPPSTWDRLIAAWRKASDAERRLLTDIAAGEGHGPQA